MTFFEAHKGHLLLLLLLLLAIFVLDWLMPLGYVVWVLYLVPLVMASRLHHPYALPLTTAASSVLTMIGFFVSPPGLDPRSVIVNRTIGIAGFWLVAALLQKTRSLAEAAERSAARLNSVFSSTPAVVYAAHASGDYGATFVSPNVTAQLGYRPADFTNDASFWVDHIHPDDREPVLAGLPHLFAQGSHVHEYRFQHKDGRYRWMRDELRVIRDEAGHPIELVGSWLDITERKRTEQALLAVVKGISTDTGERFFRSLAEQLAAALDADYACVAEVRRDAPYLAKTLAFCAHGAIADNFEYDMRRAPCEEVFAKHPCSYPRSVQQQFPQDTWLAEVGAEAYVGAPLFDSAGRPLGLINVIYCRPLESAGLAEAVLQIFAARAAGELERTKADVALQRLKLAVDHAGDVIAYIDAEGRFVYVNQTMCRAFGYTEDELLAMRVPDVDVQFNLDRYRALFEQAQQGPLGPFESTIRRKDGSLFPVEIAVGRIDHEGVPLLLGILRDISDRKAADAAQRRSADLLRSIVNNASSVIYLLNLRNEYLLVNDRWLALTGLRLEEVIGKTPRDFLPPEVAERFVRSHAAVLASGTALEAEEIVELPTGTRTYLSTKFPLRDQDGSIYAICGISTDITERKQMETALRESEQRFFVTLHNAEVGLWDWNMTTNDVSLDQRWNAILGYGPSEFLPNRLETWQTTMHPDDAPTVYGTLDKHLNDPGALYDVVYRAKHKSGRWVWINSRGRVVEQSADGRPIRMMGTIQDITDRKEAEAQLRRYSEGLEQMVAERTAQVQALEARRMQMEKLAALGQLAAGVAHEINNPLAGIKNSFLLLKDAVPPGHPRHQYLALIDREIARIVGIVRRLYELYKPTPPEPAAIDLRAAIEDVRETVSRYLAERQVSLRVEMPDQLERCFLPPQEMHQVLCNLVQNAAHASPIGGTVTVRIVRRSDTLEIRVADKGIGIAPDVLPHIFDPFFTTKQDDRVEHHGHMGLGLSVSRSLVEAMGGRITVDSRIGEGSVFTIHLPLTIGTQAGPFAPSPPSTASMSSIPPTRQTDSTRP